MNRNFPIFFDMPYHGCTPPNCGRLIVDAWRLTGSQKMESFTDIGLPFDWTLRPTVKRGFEINWQERSW